MNRIKRFWRLWKLSKYEDVFVVKDPIKFEDLQAAGLDENIGEIVVAPNEGDGNAVFIGEGTHEEFIDYENDQKGLKVWYDRLKKL